MKAYRKIERRIVLLAIWICIVMSIGGIVEIAPLFKKDIAIKQSEKVRRYTPLELLGFHIFKREGCYNCHSQQIRKLPFDVARYGKASDAGESMYDFPFMWASQRKGPDLSRVGLKYSDEWHKEHLSDPRRLTPGSIMPAYKFFDRQLDYSKIERYLSIYKLLDVPYTEEDIKNAKNDILAQTTVGDEAMLDSFNNRYSNVYVRKFDNNSPDITEFDAIIAYLQTLGNKAYEKGQ